MKINNLYYSKAQSSNSSSTEKVINDLPIEIKNRIHHLSTHVKKSYNAAKAKRYKKYVDDLEKMAEYYSYDIYIDDESLPSTGVIRLVSNNILLHDEFTQDASADLLSMLKYADEVVVENYNSDANDSLVSLTIKYYLFDVEILS